MDTESAFHCYQALVASYLHGIDRLQAAQLAGLRLQSAVLTYRSQPRPTVIDHPYRSVIDEIGKLSRREYEAFEYVTRVSTLVYLTTLLDTFLSDTTKFLLLLNPRSIGKNRTVLLEHVLNAQSPHDLVNQAAAEKTREVSYLSFSSRIDLLRSQFGLRIDTSDLTIERLTRLAELRNVTVHDQAVFTCEIDSTGKLGIKQKACSVHPTRISGDDVDEARDLYWDIVADVVQSVVEQVLKQASHLDYIPLKRGLSRKNLKTTNDGPHGDA